MRKPKAIDAELAALAERTAALKARRVAQLGELVIATGADALEVEALAGALLSAAGETDAAAQRRWRVQGEAFFRGGKADRATPPASGDSGTAGQTPRSGPAG
ncbi:MULTISPECIES: conjugal transfer protein TraD [Brevundimonas]|jgi:hypothetical protein|uniref:Conjugal transfer protein TraD n=1 Tax=Brevundimonas abyssalis TAR-001 TaxID=1391729 RepID=A0A8E0KJ96_9CAUL|nr:MULTISPECIES: conjugal transfer protein TraD [Brevundimonas]GAD58129.1 hypothetical protein MBEBAB_0379 [Brevundimonas abyssalis TAR-001]